MFCEDVFDADNDVFRVFFCEGDGLAAFEARPEACKLRHGLHLFPKLLGFSGLNFLGDERLDLLALLPVISSGFVSANTSATSPQK